MDEQNTPKLILQLDRNGNIFGIDITTNYNILEKLTFIEMNDKQLFPYKNYNNYSYWRDSLMIFDITRKIFDTLNSIRDLIPQIDYPGY